MVNTENPEETLETPEVEKISEEEVTSVENENEVPAKEIIVDEKEQKTLDEEVETVLKDEDKNKPTKKNPKEKKKEEKGKTSEEKGKTSEEKGKDKKGKKKRKQPKIDINKNPKLKKVLHDAERIEDATYLKELRDQHNNTTRNLINSIKKIQIEISNIRNQALDYRSKRDSLNKEVQEIKVKKNTISEQLNSSRSTLKEVKAEARKTDDGNGQSVRIQIKNLRRKIEHLEKRIETEDLELREENQIVDEIDKLERKLQDLVRESTKPSQFKDHIDKIRTFREDLKEINQKLRDSAEESQNYHLLYLDVSKEMDDLRGEKRNLQRELNENRYIADIYHQRLIELSQRLKRQKRIVRKSQYQNKKKVRKEIQKMALEDAKDKMKKGAKLNIFEARAFLEAQANKKQD
ncbi:MAG: DUF7121 family protein [Promethearchaeota archaeon]